MDNGEGDAYPKNVDKKTLQPSVASGTSCPHKVVVQYCSTAGVVLVVQYCSSVGEVLQYWWCSTAVLVVHCLY